ncbi:MAG: 3-hydroxyacyl-CoA dehydrogenase/enoyl-CoA hydratase family protein [Oscillospiraceae bacterium]|nr:3-hydroxyacyl-CoA dehydrogenase/enoyl-CoA hydratase family protein [Oscillospiraceae bacterium]
MIKNINKAVVFGAGVMGASIAGLLASVGVETVLLDIVPPQGLTDEEKAKGLTEDSYEFRNRFSLAGLDRIKKPRNNMTLSKGAVKNVRIGNTTDNLDEIDDADWIVEAVSERIDIKQSVLKQIAPHRKPDAIVSSNTSGVNCTNIVSVMDDEFKKYFMGTHFFNPPRWMALFEMIPTQWTDKGAYERMQHFAENGLGKVVCHAKDTPNFVGNRIGVFAAVTALRLAEKYGYDVPTLDLLTGPIMAHPKSATCKTCDMVGIDVLAAVAGNVLAVSNDEREKVEYDLPQYVKDMVTDGHLGDKVKNGFYKKEIIDGKKTVLCYDHASKTYINKKADEVPAIAEAKNHPNKYEFMTFGGDSKEQQFTYEFNKTVLLYAARLVPEIADDYKEIDKALVSGFNWDMGVFGMWDQIGVRKSCEAWAKDGEVIPQWVLDRLAAGKEKFFEEGADDCKFLKLSNTNVVKENEDASIRDMGDGVLCCEFHCTANAITENVGEMILEGTEMLKGNDWVGMVVGNEGKNFCAGADLFTIYSLATDKEWDKLDALIRGLQDGTKALKYAVRPTVSAPFGQTLGGGCEVTMHCQASVPHTDTFMGLVEFGVGLVPAGGGCSELLRRVMDRCWDTAKTARYNAVKSLWQAIAMAKVNMSADAAVEAGYLDKGTYIERNKAKQLQSAKEQVLWMAAHDYRPGADPTIKVVGEYGYGAIAYDLLMAKNGGFMSEHDTLIATKVAHIITGGDLPYGAEVPLQQIRDLEREAFLSLAGTEKTQERIMTMLANGKAVRN